MPMASVPEPVTEDTAPNTETSLRAKDRVLLAPMVTAVVPREPAEPPLPT